jgi:hypothetical protein
MCSLLYIVKERPVIETYRCVRILQWEQNKGETSMIHTIHNALIYIAAWACNGALQRKQRRRLHSVLAAVIPGQMTHDVGLNVIFILKRNGSHPALQQ